jgi:hypothetical protein
MKIFSLFFFLLFSITATETFAIDFTVNQAGDAGDFTCDATCTLRDAVDDANALPATNDTISFAAGLTTITLINEIQINNAGTLTITGAGANVLTINGGAGINRIFNVNGATVTIRGVTLSGGNGNGAAVNASGGTLILEEVVVQNNAGDSSVGAVYFTGGTNHRIANSTFSGNTGFRDCAAIYAFDTSLTVVNTTVSGNSTAASRGFGTGAICIIGGTATFRSTTISGNTANGTDGGGGGGIYIQETATVNLGNTIVAGNNAAGPGPDLFSNNSTANFTTSGGNLIGDNSGSATNPNTVTFPTGNPNANGDKVGTGGSVINPLLGPLQNNGGPTPTRALLAGSPAIDSGVNTLATAAGLTTDQRGTGFPRIRDGNGDGTAIVDIGAFEVQVAPTAATVSVSGRVTAGGRKGVSNATVHLTTQSGETQTTRTNRSGYYKFKDLAAGETYIFNVFSKRYQFTPQVVSLTEEIAELDFTAQ